jgi:flagellar hook-basal body protein
MSARLTPVTQTGTYPSYTGTSVVPNGALITPVAQQRYGIEVTYDAVNQKFSFSSGTTGDKSSISITNLSNLAQDIFGFGGDQTVRTSSQAARGLTSTPAIMTGSPLAVNVSNNFSIDPSNNTFVVSVNNVKGTVVLPNNPSQTLHGFLQQLQDGINSLVSADGESVSGVTVSYDSVKNALKFTTGNTGDNAFIQVTSQAPAWGLASVTSGRGATSTWTKPTQTMLNLNGQQVPQYIDAKGNSTSSASGFTTLPAWSPIYLKQGELTFNTAGQLVSPIEGTKLNTVYLADGKGALTININYAKSTQFTSAFAVASESQDGAPEGDLTGVNIGDNGLVNASYSNGTQKSLGKVVLANFSNPTGLQQIGNSSFYASSSSGVARFGQPGTAGFGTVKAGALENANVDLTGELVDLITEQRNFQASAKAIDTDNQLTTTIIQIR